MTPRRFLFVMHYPGYLRYFDSVIRMGTPLTSLHVASAGTLRMLLGLSGDSNEAFAEVEKLPAASAGPR